MFLELVFKTFSTIWELFMPQCWRTSIASTSNRQRIMTLQVNPALAQLTTQGPQMRDLVSCTEQ